jgi:hypothetical protein
MGKTEHSYNRRGCSGGELKPADAPSLIPTEPDALLQHWRAMAMITLKAEPVDLGKLEFCVKRMRFWHEHMTKGTE